MIATATAYGCMAFALILGPDVWKSTESYQLLGKALPFQVWGAIFGSAALAAGISAGWNWPKLRLVVMPIVTGASAAWAVGLIAAGVTDHLRGVGAPIVWTFVSIIHFMESGRPSYVAPSLKRQVEAVLREMT